MALGLDMVGSIPAHGFFFVVLGTAYKSNSHRAEEEEVGNNIFGKKKEGNRFDPAPFRPRPIVVPSFLFLACQPTSDQPTFRCASCGQNEQGGEGCVRTRRLSDELTSVVLCRVNVYHNLLMICYFLIAPCYYFFSVQACRSVCSSTGRATDRTSSRFAAEAPSSSSNSCRCF